MKYSIKTVDGSRFDFVPEDNREIDLDEMMKHSFIGFPIDGGTKYFNVLNIVSITERGSE